MDTLEQESFQSLYDSIDWSITANVLEEISKFIFTGKYARFREDLGRRETWDEAVARIELMHLNRFSDLDESLKEEIRWAFSLVNSKRVVPSMRSMQFGGIAVEAKNERIYNCSVRHVDSIRSFSEVFFLLLCGCGVGLGLTRKYLNRLPDLVAESDKTGTVITYVVQDDIEGWADSLEALLNCFFRGNAYSGRRIIFDYSKIRRKGSVLKTGGGKAPGYRPLKAAHQRIKILLDEVIEQKHQTRLKSIDAYDILMHAADAVLSGGVRRSATSVVFDKNDVDMIEAKTGDWFKTNPQRARSNNSVLLVRNNVSLEEFRAIVQRTRSWGEPGFVFAENEDTLFNPCFEVGFIPVTDDGVCGVQFCNLTSINGSKIHSISDFLECAKAAAIIGTLQATYTDFPYLSQTAQQLTEDEALLGVSITAMLENPQVILDPIVQQQASKVVVDTNKIWADVLGVNQSARCCVIKPEGTGSLALGTMSSGIHAAHDHLMFRRIQVNKIDNVYQHLKAFNPTLCEQSVWSNNGTDDVITFPVRVPLTALVKNDIDALTHLDIIKSTQENWVIPGTTSANKKNVHHNVSCTVVVQSHEWSKVIDYLYFNRGFFTAVSLIPDSLDKKFEQAPNESVTTLEDLKKFKDLLYSTLPVDYGMMRESTDHTTLQQELACAGPEGCEVKYL